MHFVLSSDRKNILSLTNNNISTTDIVTEGSRINSYSARVRIGARGIGIMIKDTEVFFPFYQKHLKDQSSNDASLVKGESGMDSSLAHGTRTAPRGSRGVGGLFNMKPFSIARHVHNLAFAWTLCYH